MRKEDYQTNTVDGAEAFERFNAEPDYDSHYEDMCDELEEEEQDECGCSDWGCPCSGTKKGGL